MDMGKEYLPTGRPCQFLKKSFKRSIKEVLCKNDILNEATFPKPVPKNLKDSNRLALYH